MNDKLVLYIWCSIPSTMGRDVPGECSSDSKLLIKRKNVSLCKEAETGGVVRGEDWQPKVSHLGRAGCHRSSQCHEG